MKKPLFFTAILLSLIIQLKSQNNTYKVYALKFGELKSKMALSTIAVGATEVDSVKVNYMMWVLLGRNGRRILVDAGFTDSTNIMDIKYVRPDIVLKRLNINPEEITDIIITHPHWDHVGGIDLFPNAMVWMQKDDYNYFVGDAWQKDGNKSGFSKMDVHKLVQKNLDRHLTLVKGDDIEILPGIRVFLGGKHTHSSQFVLVNTKTEPVIIASDNSWYYYNLTHLLPIPITHDQKAYVQSLERMKSMVKDIDLIIPGHDPAVMTKFKSVAEDVVKIKD